MRTVGLPGAQNASARLGVCELQCRDGDAAAVNRIKEVTDLKEYDVKFFLGNLYLYPTSFMIVGLWYPKRTNLLFR